MGTAQTVIEQQDFWKSHSAAWRISGLTQQKYCEQQDINYASFVYQHNKLSSMLKNLTINFIESKPEQVEVNIPSAVLQFMLPNGVRIGITAEVNASLIQTILTVAGGLSC